MWKLFRREEKRAITAIDGYWPDYNEPSNQFGHVTVSRALSLVPVFAAVRLLSDAISSMPLLLLKRDERGIAQRQPTPSLFKNPSVHGTTVDWIHRAVVSMALQGDAIGLITQRDFYNYPTMIEWLNPENVATHDGKLEGPGSYINPMWWWWGRPIDPTNLLHIPWFTMPWRVRGLSPIGAYQLTINRGIGAAEYGTNWYANGGVPPGHFRNTAKIIEEKDATALTSRFMARLQSRKPLVTGSDWEYTPIAIKPHEALFVETATIDLLTFCLHPWMVKFEAALSNCFPGPYYVRLDPTDMLRVDAETQANIDQTSLGFQAPAWMEVDEVRANRDLPPMKNPPKPAGQEQTQTQPAQTKQDVLVPGRPTDGPSLNGHGEHRSYNGREELVRLQSMRQRWTNGAHVAMKGS